MEGGNEVSVSERNYASWNRVAVQYLEEQRPQRRLAASQLKKWTIQRINLLNQRTFARRTTLFVRTS